MSSLNDSLAKITKGTGIVFVGYLVSMLLGFVGRPLIVRCGTEADIMALLSYLDL